mmetsp:Transcript_72398/g.151094  ORF Transcript_72398/g.151094 Transcript_72398/m.151094 type:complete len:235 (+) Transcript_72398:417-1121(+)
MATLPQAIPATPLLGPMATTRLPHRPKSSGQDRGAAVGVEVVATTATTTTTTRRAATTGTAASSATASGNPQPPRKGGEAKEEAARAVKRATSEDRLHLATTMRRSQRRTSGSPPKRPRTSSTASSQSSNRQPPSRRAVVSCSGGYSSRSAPSRRKTPSSMAPSALSGTFRWMPLGTLWFKHCSNGPPKNNGKVLLPSWKAKSTSSRLTNTAVEWYRRCWNSFLWRRSSSAYLN